MDELGQYASGSEGPAALPADGVRAGHDGNTLPMAAMSGRSQINPSRRIPRSQRRTSSGSLLLAAFRSSDDPSIAPAGARRAVTGKPETTKNVELLLGQELDESAPESVPTGCEDTAGSSRSVGHFSRDQTSSGFVACGTSRKLGMLPLP